MIFRLYDCDVGFQVEGQNYDFEHVDSVTIEDPESNKLIRGANASNKVGLAYKEGLKEPKRITYVLVGLSKEIHDLLVGVFEEQERVSTYVISRKDGSSRFAKNAVLAQLPHQLTLDDSAESLNVSLTFETFDLKTEHKS